MRQDIEKRGESLKGKAPPRCLGEDGLLPPLSRTPFLEEGARLRLPPLPCPYIYLRYWGLQTHEFFLFLAQPYLSPSSSPTVLGEALLESHAPPSPPRRCATAGWSLPQPLPLSLLDQGVGDIVELYMC